MTMFVRRSLMSSAAQIFRAPEDDRGHAEQGDFDPLSDFTDDDAGDLDDDDDQGVTGFDDDDDDDAGGNDDDDDNEDEPPARRARPESRAEKRIRALQAELNELKTRGPAAAPQATGPTPEQQAHAEAQHLATLTAEERVQYLLQKNERNTNAALQGLQFQIADTADKSSFDALCRSKPALARMADKVESTLADMRAKGSTAPRETVAAYLLGQQLLKGKSNAPKQRREAAANRERQEARPGNGRSDARASSGKATDQQARKKRLEGMNI